MAEGHVISRFPGSLDNGEGLDMKTRLACPCGACFVAPDEDQLVEQVQAHLADAHPDMEYDREHILFIAT